MPALAGAAITRNAIRIGPAADDTLTHAVAQVLRRRADRLDAIAAIIDALSPQATLRRGFSITRVDGHAITSPTQAPPGATITTTLASGTLTSVSR